MRSFAFVIVSMLAIGAASMSAQDGGEKDKKDSGKIEKKTDKGSPLTVVTGAGKEVKLFDWRITHGTRQFSLNGDEKPNPKSKSLTGSEYLEFREEKSTTYKNGIFTLVPLTSIRKITYDREKKTVAVAVVAGGDEDVVLSGATKFTGTNKLTLEADETIEGLEGKAAVSYQGGVDKGVQSIAFAAPKPVAKVAGVESTVTADDKEKSKHPAHDVQPLYLVDGAYRTVPYLMFKTSVKVDMDKIVSLKFVQPESKKAAGAYEVTLKTGVKHTLSLITSVETEKKKNMTLVGLIGRVPAGYKLFSLDAIYEYRLPEDEKK